MSLSCEHAGDAADVGDEQPCFGAGDGFLPVFRHAATASEPGEGALDHPSARDQFEANGSIRTLDNLNGSAPDLLDCPAQFWPSVAAVGEGETPNATRPRERVERAAAGKFWRWTPALRALHPDPECRPRERQPQPTIQPCR